MKYLKFSACERNSGSPIIMMQMLRQPTTKHCTKEKRHCEEAQIIRRMFEEMFRKRAPRYNRVSECGMRLTGDFRDVDVNRALIGTEPHAREELEPHEERQALGEPDEQ